MDHGHTPVGLDFRYQYLEETNRAGGKEGRKKTYETLDLPLSNVQAAILKRKSVVSYFSNG